VAGSITLSPLAFPMIALALDTTGRAGSVAVVRGGQVLAEIAGDSAITHAARLPGDLMEVLAQAGVPLGTIDLLAVAAGPGSFTGLRVGIAAMQGLAMAINKPIVPVSTLDALAHPAASPAAPLVASWVDAQRGEVFSALYESGTATPMSEPTALPPLETITTIAALAAGRRIYFVGDGATRYAERIVSALGEQADVASIAPRLAGAIGLIATASPERAIAPHAVAPIYIRRPDVELARDRRMREA
jgi:tRNA threonylcarbamoyladenosine biosynthesis protein TsaB